MKTLLDLKNKMNKLADYIPKRANAIKQIVATEVLRDLTNRTPVDTGLAISNWQVAIGSSIDDEIDAYVPGFHGDTETANTELAFHIGQFSIITSKPGDAIHIGNAALHIDLINEPGFPFRADQSRPNSEFVEAAIAVGYDKLRELEGLERFD